MVASVFRLTLQTVGHIHYLPMLAAVIATALVARRPATIAAIGLSIIADMVILPRQGVADAVVHAALFVAVAFVMAEVCHRLNSRSALLDSILASVPVVTLNGEGRILRITPAAADLLGVTPADALARPFSTFVSDFGTTALAAVIHRVPLSLPATGSWLARRPDGEVVPLTIHASLLSPSVNPERMVLSLGDQRQAAAANDRMRDLMNQLSKSWRLNSMGEMAATLAHELNQPLTAATVYLHAGQTDIARAGPLGDSAGRALDLAKTQLIRAGDIIRRMREFVSTGARELTDQRVSSMIEDLRPLFDLIRVDTGVVIRVDVRDIDDHVLADRIQFQQAINNLVRNAVDAAAGRELGLVRITGRSLGNQGYEIVVEDDGPGIPEDQMDRIFQPMTTTKASGMGLGLSVTRSIIESHDAVLTVGRSPLGGAAFSFRLSPVSELEAA
ncbi:MAG: two-component system sensor histidine kinase NtrB [Brevundimonas sp.]